jgi:ABC-type uncharacterized transport system permease subunit
LAVAYVWISIRRVESVFGLFLLPTVLVLIWISSQFGKSHSFSADHARTVWNMIHGASLLLGTTVVALGCTFGILYLLQANRLKRKTLRLRWFRLPSLEWLQQSCERTLVISAGLLAIGLISGIAINQVGATGTDRAGTIAWSDPVVWSSGILFGWLLAATVFNLFYRPARRGRKVAYLVVASFLFLVLELGIVWWAGHATTKANAKAPDRESVPTVAVGRNLCGESNVTSEEFQHLTDGSGLLNHPRNHRTGALLAAQGHRSTALAWDACPREGAIA